MLKSQIITSKFPKAKNSIDASGIKKNKISNFKK